MSTGSKKNKTLLLLVVILLLSNLGLLLYFFAWKKPGYKNGGGPRGEFAIVDFMKKEIGFTEEQTKQFKALHEANRDSLKILGENIRKAKTELYSLLQQGNTPDSLINSTAEKMSQYQKRMEISMFYHFQKVRAICNTEQKIKLDSLVNRMNNRPPWFRRGGGPSRAIDGEKKKK